MVDEEGEEFDVEDEIWGKRIRVCNWSLYSEIRD
jgi:hypothetical protein